MRNTAQDGCKHRPTGWTLLQYPKEYRPKKHETSESLMHIKRCHSDCWAVLMPKISHFASIYKSQESHASSVGSFFNLLGSLGGIKGWLGQESTQSS